MKKFQFGLTVPEMTTLMGGGLYKLRINAQLTQEEIAARCQCSRITIQKIEAGDVNVSIKYYCKYIASLNADYILNGFREVKQFGIRKKRKIIYQKRIRKPANQV